MLLTSKGTEPIQFQHRHTRIQKSYMQTHIFKITIKQIQKQIHPKTAVQTQHCGHRQIYTTTKNQNNKVAPPVSSSPINELPAPGMLQQGGNQQGKRGSHEMREKNRQQGEEWGLQRMDKWREKKNTEKVVYLKSQRKTDSGAERKTKITQSTQNR